MIIETYFWKWYLMNFLIQLSSNVSQYLTIKDIVRVSKLWKCSSMIKIIKISLDFEISKIILNSRLSPHKIHLALFMIYLSFFLIFFLIWIYFHFFYFFYFFLILYKKNGVSTAPCKLEPREDICIQSEGFCASWYITKEQFVLVVMSPTPTHW